MDKKIKINEKLTIPRYQKESLSFIDLSKISLAASV